jgi:hypothetical protein
MTLADVEETNPHHQKLESYSGSPDQPDPRSEMLVARAETKSMPSTAESEDKQG